MSNGVIRLQPVNTGYNLFGSTEITCAYVASLICGTIINGVRFLTESEVTEELLASIEQHFFLLVT